MASKAFSSHLTTAMQQMHRTFYTDCTSGDFVCSNGFLLSVSTVLAAFVVVTFIFVLLQKCCKKDIEYEPVFNTFKGFVKWVYLPLVYAATVDILEKLNMSELKTMDLILPGIILIVAVLLPIVQLIGYKCIQVEKDPIWRKWL